MPPIIDQDHPEAEESRQGGDVDTVDITVLSPSPGVPDSFILRGVSLDTTVRELKLRLSTALDRHPAPAEQRLILRGRPLARDDDTVQAILQTEIYGHPKQQAVSLHLVLPPAPAESSVPLSSQQQQQQQQQQQRQGRSSPWPRFPSSSSSGQSDAVPHGYAEPGTAESVFLPAGSAQSQRPSAREEGNATPAHEDAWSRERANAPSPRAQVSDYATAARNQYQHQQQQQLLVGLGMAVFHYERQMRAGMPVSTEALTGLRDELRQRASTLQHVPVSRDHAADSAGARSQGQIADYFAGRVQAMIDSRVEAVRLGCSAEALSSAQSTAEPWHARHEMITTSAATQVRGGSDGRTRRLLPPQPLQPQAQAYILAGVDGYQALLVPPPVPPPIAAPHHLRTTMPLAGSHPPLHGGYAVASGAGQYLSPLYPQPYLPLPLQPLPYSYGMGRPPGPPSPHQQRPQPGQPQPRQQQPQPAVFIAQINVAIWIRRIWTLVRLIAMLYLFDAGGGDSLLSRNTLLVLAIALCFMQGTPIPGMLREAFMGPIQRQVNQLLPVDDGHEREAGDEQRAGHAGQHHGRLHGGDDSGGDGAAVGAARPVPPQATAAAAPPATQGRFRSLQQSIMLFVATLVPGVGERQIAQRLALREAVARRRRAEESSAEREQVQQAQQQREQATAALADNRRGSDTGQTTATQVAREGESDARSTAETARMRSESSPAGSGTGGASE